jgi:SAM-dependent methyltransferase
MVEKSFYDVDYYENGPKSGKSNFREYTYRKYLNSTSALLETLKAMEPDMFKENTSVLDMGCAKGFFLKWLRQSATVMTGRLCGVEISDYAFDNIMKGIEKLHCSVSGPLPFNTDEFDVVTAFDCLEHIPFPDTIQAIQNVVKIAKNYIVLSLPVWYDNNLPDQTSFSTDKSHVAVFTNEWWIAWITQSDKFKLTSMIHAQNNVIMVFQSKKLYKERFVPVDTPE